MGAALAAEEDESPTALALNGASSFILAISLATTFKTETGGAVPPLAPRREPVPDSSLNIADPIGAVPGIDRMDTHPEGRAVYLPTVHGATGRTTETFHPILGGMGDPRGTENRQGLHETENRDPYRLSRRRPPGTHRTEAEYCSAMCLAGREHSPKVKQKEPTQQHQQPLPMARATKRSGLPFPLCGLAAHGSSTPTGG